MSLEHIFFISQTVSSFAIVGSLFFLGLEVHHTNREARHREAEESLQKLREMELAMAADADRARVWLAGLHDFEGLEPVDKVRFLLISHMTFKTNESFFLAFQNGRLSRELYEPEERHQAEFFAYPGLQAAWQIRKHYFHSGFQKWVAEKIAIAREIERPPFLYHEGPAPGARLGADSAVNQ
jgi:hypothetical protein